MQGDSRQQLGRNRGRRYAGIIAGLVATAVLAFATPASAETDGEVDFVRNITSSATSQLLAAQDDPARQSFWRERYASVRGYSPYYDDHTFSGSPSWTPPPSEFYRDLYAIYNNAPGNQIIASHPDWVLRDSSGNKLYIQYACSGGSCTQYAADIGNPEFRAHWINQARATMAEGYSGIFVDDVNLTMRVSDGTGTFTRPLDERTGAPMTDTAWRRYVAEFTEAIRAAFPTARIVHNVYWRNHATLKSDAYALRELASADAIEAERGFNDAGIVGGTGTYGYETYLAHMDWLHQRGRSIVYEPYGLTATSAEFELASYYLVKDHDDSIASAFQADPDAWWSGWETDLGTPSGARYTWNGLFRRDFANGTVLVNQPGATTKTVGLPAGSQWHDLSGAKVTSVTLGARRGKVLVKGPIEDPPPPPPPPSADVTPPETSISSAPSGTITASSANLAFESSESGSSFQCRLDTDTWSSCTSPKSYSSLAEGAHSFAVRAIDEANNVDPTPATRDFTVATSTAPGSGGQVSIKPRKPKVREGSKIMLTGEAVDAPSVAISSRGGGGWRSLASAVEVVDGSFRVAIRARRPGRHWFRASAAGFGDSNTVRVRVRGR